jgi:hydroxyethylthiazole kinase-like uncharacterized protein yjeF
MIDIHPYLQKLQLPKADSHKGQNGKLLIVGGSQLFHAASKWSLDIASRFVDMVFYSSVPSNNELIQEAKGQFWNGIVIPRSEVEAYLEEADCILIGPGMEREKETEEIINSLLTKYPNKKWVIDAGALQMMDIGLLNERCVITPHKVEWEQVQAKAVDGRTQEAVAKSTVVIKGEVDIVLRPGVKLEIEGGNAGMTKGGTGDVLAGLIAGLYTTQDIEIAAVIGSYINKKAGDALFTKVGPFFNASDLVAEIPRVLWDEVEPVK